MQATKPDISQPDISRAPDGESRFAEVSALLESGIESGVAPGMVLLVGRDGEVLFHKSAGTRYSKPEREASSNTISTDTVFDIAALTNVVVTTTLIMKLVEGGKLKLEDRASRYLQGFGVMGKSPITVGHLLSHTSGLVAWAPYYEDLVKANAGSRLGILTSRGAKESILNQILRSQLKSDPGTKQVYSDVGFILLGHLIEVLTGLSLDKAANKYVIQPLGMKSTSYIDLSMIKRRGIHPVTDLIAPTEECPWRKRVLCGEVHDDNAWVMGGIAGHSGLFSTAHDLHLFAREIILALRGSSSFLKKETLLSFWRKPDISGGEGWRFGWDSPGRDNGMDESGLSDEAAGISGFTGCSLWIEPKYGLDIALMTNRIHPGRSNKKILSFRPQIHAAVLKAVTGL